MCLVAMQYYLLDDVGDVEEVAQEAKLTSLACRQADLPHRDELVQVGEVLPGEVREVQDRGGGPRAHGDPLGGAQQPEQEKDEEGFLFNNIKVDFLVALEV
jgi:hypothetical protein